MVNAKPLAQETDVLGTQLKANKKHVLVVDDEPYIVNLVKLTLDNAQYVVHGAHSAMEALELAQVHPIKAVIVDIMMPEIDGYQLCKSFRNMEKMKDVPIIILSAKDIGAIMDAIDVGATDFVKKPFDPHNLSRKVELHLWWAEKKRWLQVEAET